jgi:hypothetical protein
MANPRDPKDTETDVLDRPGVDQEGRPLSQAGVETINPLVEMRQGKAGVNPLALITVNPMMTSNAPGTFTTTVDGMIQGVAQDDPAMRNQLVGGVLDIAEVMPIFGGVPISEYIPAMGPMAPDQSLGNIVKRATDPTNMMGICVFNQAHHAINTPQSQVPQIFPGMSVHYYRWGSLMRIPMNADPALMAILGGAPVWPQALCWDVANQWVTTAGIAFPNVVRLVGYSAGNCMTVSFDAVSGYSNWNRSGNCVLLQI